jgi:hypothetical protein
VYVSLIKELDALIPLLMENIVEFIGKMEKVLAKQQNLEKNDKFHQAKNGWKII